MGKKIKLLFSILLAVAVLICTISVIFFRESKPISSAVTGHKNIKTALYNHTDKKEYKVFTHENMNIAEKTVNDNSLLLREGNTLSISFSTETEKTFHIRLIYKAVYGKIMQNTLSLCLDDSLTVADAPLLWADSEGGAPLDRYGNEVVPSPICIDEYVTEYLSDYGVLDSSAKIFKISAGKHSLKLTADTQDMLIRSISLIEAEKTVNYNTYISKFGNMPSGEKVIIEAENYSLKSDSSIHASNIQNSALNPYSINKKLLNVLDGKDFNSTGQRVVWQFDVSKSGLYTIGFRYKQDEKIGVPVYRKIEIDGSVPFSEWEDYPFPDTPSGKFTSYVLTEKVYLEKGEHTIALKVSAKPLDLFFSSLRQVMVKINDISMDMKKLTGSTPDKNRTWDIEAYRPNVVNELISCAESCENIYEGLKAIENKEPVFANNLVYAAKALRELAKNPDTLPGKMDRLCEGTGSVLQYLGDILEPLTSQPITIDSIFLGEMSRNNKPVNLFKRLADFICSFANTFNTKANEEGYSTGGKNDKNELSVWVNRSVQYVEILQQMCDTEYSSAGGMSVRISIMPNEQKLVLSNAAGTNPDAALGVAYWTPYDFAIRGAAENLLEYEDFLTFYAEQYSLESLAPLCFGDGVYGAIETQDYNVLFYRKDILERLGLAPPDTWDDLKAMMPTLHRYSMNFCLPLSTLSSFKSFHMTSPYFYQNGADFYSSDRTSTNYRSENSLKAFKEMTDIFSVYSASKSLPSFYNSFRYGSVPMGIGGFGMYMQLKTAAPEILGQWEIAPAPGTVNEDGTVSRYQVADGTAAMIFKNSNKKKQAYQFLKWWLSKDTQVNYAYNVQSRFGVEYQWNTANVTAFSELPYSASHKKTILEQWQWQKETPRHPAGYMVERELSNAWNNVVISGKEIMPMLDKAELTANREIIKKLAEFGYLDKDGNVIKNFVNITVDDLRKMYNDKKGD